MWTLEQKIYEFSRGFKFYVQEIRENIIFRRNLLSLILVGCMVTGLLVYLFDETYRGKKFMIGIFGLVCFTLAAMLQYQNNRDQNYHHRRNPYLAHTKVKASPFQAESEKRTKELMQSTNERLSSSHKAFYGSRFGAMSGQEEQPRKRLDFDKSSFSQIHPSSPQKMHIERYDERPSSHVHSLSHGFGSSSYREHSFERRGYGSAMHSSQQAQQKDGKSVRDLKIPTTFGLGNREKAERPQPQYLQHSHTRSMERSFDGRYTGYGRSESTGRSGSFQGINEYNNLSARQNNVDYVEYSKRFEAHLETVFKWKPDYFNKMITNCKRFVHETFITRVSKENVENIKELNRLISCFDKRLYEFECLLKLDTRGIAESINLKANFTTILVEDLINHVKSVENQGPMWSCNFSVKNPEEVNKIYQSIIACLKKREYFDKILAIPGFHLSEIRAYVTERLFYISKPTVTPSNMPSDKRIVANLFFRILHEITNKDQDKGYINFLMKGDCITYDEDNNSRLYIYQLKTKNNPELVYFVENNLSEQEVHYDIISGWELWPAKPGPDNLYSAIVLFVKHFRDNIPTTDGLEKRPLFREFLKGIIPDSV